MRNGADISGLIRAARGGDVEALNRLLAAYRNYLRVLADAGIGRALRVKADPSDLAQETLLRASTNFGQFRGTTGKELTAWLRRILARSLAGLARSYLGTAARDPAREERLEEILYDSSAALARLGDAREDSPSRAAIREEHAVLLADILAQLSEEHRRVIVLRDLEQLSWEEVGARMERTADAARMLWARALKSLGPLVEGRST